MAKIGTRDPKLGNLIKYEEGTHVGYCREVLSATEAGATDYVIGTLLGTDGTDWFISDPVAVDGSEVPVAVVIEAVSLEAATATDVIALVRGSVVVADDAIVLGDHVLADAEAGLATVGIKTAVQV